MTITFYQKRTAFENIKRANPMKYDFSRNSASHIPNKNDPEDFAYNWHIIINRAILKKDVGNKKKGYNTKIRIIFYYTATEAHIELELFRLDGDQHTILYTYDKYELDLFNEQVELVKDISEEISVVDLLLPNFINLIKKRDA